MFDILSTVELTVSASIAVGSLAWAMAETARGRTAVLVALGAWFAFVLAIGATGALSPAGGGAPALGLTVVLPIVALVWAYFARPSVRTAMAATPLPALIALHAIRLLGFTFVVLYAEGRLPAPFAPSAGWGDMLIGATALPLAWAVARLGARVRPLVLLWNALGVADLVIALTLGPLSAPGPLQVFVGPPDSSPMTTLPWLIIPGFLVPILFFIHVVIFHRLLARNEASKPAHAWIGGGQCKVGLKTATPGTRPGVGGRLADWPAGLFATASKRRRAVLPAGAPPPVPSGVRFGVTPWGTGRPRTGRRRRSESAS